MNLNKTSGAHSALVLLIAAPSVLVVEVHA